MVAIKQRIRIKCEQGHIFYLPLPAPKLNALQFCPSCDDFSRVIDIPDYWHAKCPRKGCFEFIASTEIKLMPKANSHAKRYRHEVTVYHEDQAVRQWDSVMEQWADRIPLVELMRMRGNENAERESA